MAKLIVKHEEFEVPDMFYSMLMAREWDEVNWDVLHRLLTNIKKLDDEMVWFYLGYLFAAGKDIISNFYIADNMVAGLLHSKNIDQSRR